MSERACKSVGIDLGTTYSSLAYMDAQMTPRVVSDSEGKTVTPSVVYFDEQEIIVGEIAVSQANVNADRVAQFIKVNMGDQWRQEFNNQVHTPESLSALILGQMIREAEPQIGPIPSAVITVPAYFTEKRRRATQQAGEIAGLEVVGTLNEPMAATLAYGLYRADGDQNAVVYDLGGGTFDVTIVHISPNNLEELATNGNRQLGGRDWDQVLINYVCDEFERVHHKNPRDCSQTSQDLLIECEKVKRRIGKMAKTALRVHAFGIDHAIEITRQKFEALTAHLLQTTRLTTEIALEDAGLGWKDISRIVLVGGSTHMPAVRNMLKEASGIAPDVAVNPVVAVALGAAIYAHMLDTGHEVKTVRRASVIEADDAEIEVLGEEPVEPLPVAASLSEDDSASLATEFDTPARMPTVKFVTAHGVGVKVVSKGQWKNRVLIPSNTQVPVKATERFKATGKATGASFITVEITQGSTADYDLGEVLGTGRIQLPANELPGNMVEVTMEFDEQGRLHTHAVYVKTQQEMRMSVEVQGCLREEEVVAYRDFLESTGFIRPFDSEAAMEKLVEVDEEDLVAFDDEEVRGGDEDGLPMIEPI